MTSPGFVALMRLQDDDDDLLDDEDDLDREDSDEAEDEDDEDEEEEDEDGEDETWYVHPRTREPCDPLTSATEVPTLAPS
jgi:hypothetical protein